MGGREKTGGRQKGGEREKGKKLSERQNNCRKRERWIKGWKIRGGGRGIDRKSVV